MKNDISQSLGLDLVNINVYAEVYQNIPLKMIVHQDTRAINANVMGCAPM